MAMRESNTEGKYNQSPAKTPERQIKLHVQLMRALQDVQS